MDGAKDFYDFKVISPKWAGEIKEDTVIKDFGRGKCRVHYRIGQIADHPETMRYFRKNIRMSDVMVYENGRLIECNLFKEIWPNRVHPKFNEVAEETGAQRILEVGAGTGRYSISLAKEGFEVDTVELTEHNLNIMNSKLEGMQGIRTHRGNALDLSLFGDVSFDIRGKGPVQNGEIGGNIICQSASDRI